MCLSLADAKARTWTRAEYEDVKVQVYLGSRPSTGELKEIEPHVPGLAAIRVFDAGIVDYKAVC
jgi:hypothetical protein